MNYYQLVGYNCKFWANREVSRVSNSPINHVGIRLWLALPAGGYDIKELYVSHRDTDTLVPATLVRRVLGPEIYSSERMAMFDDELEHLEELAAQWKQGSPGNLWHPYFHHYIGRHLNMTPPSTCTSMCKSFLNRCGVRVTEGFYPSRLVADFIKEVY